MSFITKRERVFNEYTDPFDLPPRNEGKLKAFSSCTDTRAWSHFHSDKSEHLVEIIKRNSEICRGKYVPINVIIEMMMLAKNAEISRLKLKIGQLEQMLTAYDQLDLSCEQKCEISTAHAMIKAAAKSLDSIPPLELDISAFTEGGIDSEGFQTGKSGGDEASVRLKGIEWAQLSEKTKRLGMEDKGFGPFGFDPEGYKGLGVDAKVSKASKINQSDLSERCGCDVSTSAHDIRVEELEEVLISKDAKLSAMQNTIAVMENDVCEPYCVYAHIYTALEKIYGTLRQNDKYRLFLDLMSSGKDTRCLDIKGKILFKLKILEKFSIALISPCSERFKYDESCECYAAQVETSFAFTQPESQKTTDVMRSNLIADIMENDEMREILIKDKSDQPGKSEDRTYEVLVSDNYSIDTENLGRIKALQIDYEDLMNTYESVKHERDNLSKRCQNYDNLEKELEDCRIKLREYNLLYNEREYYRKRSEDLDSLKEQCLVLADETSSLEIQLKAESEINDIKSGTIEDLRRDNITQEKKLNELTIAFEKERNSIMCTLKEAECKIMCQEQQIRSLSSQIDKILEQDDNHNEGGTFKSAAIMDELEALKDQIKSLNDALYASEDEKQHLQVQFEEKLKLINDLRMEIEEWKSTCEKTLQRNDYLEKYTEGFRDEVLRLVEENKMLSIDVEDKTAAVANLINVINNKSQEVNKLMNEMELKREENNELKKQIQVTKDSYGCSITELENEKRKVLESLQVARQESKELLEKVKDYDDILHIKEDMSKSLAVESESCNELRNMLVNAIEDNKKLQQDLFSHENNNSILLQEIQRLREINNFAVDNINSLQSDKEQYRMSLELTKKESEILGDKLKQFDELREELQNLRLSHEKLVYEKSKLESELRKKTRNLEDAMHSVELNKKESEHMLEKIQQSENLKEDMIKLSKDYRKLVNEKQILQNDLANKNIELDNLLHTLSELKSENVILLEKTKNITNLEQKISDLANEKASLETEYNSKTNEISNLFNSLQGKIEEIRYLKEKIKSLEQNNLENISKLQDVNLTTQTTLNSVRKESEELINKLKSYESLLNEYEDLKRAHQLIQQEKSKLQKDLAKLIGDLKRTEKEKDDFQKQAQEILLQNEDLEKVLIDTRQELMNSTSINPYDNVVKEIEDMKKEKLGNNRKIKDLLDKLDESESIIGNLNEDVMARDDKIAVLENHINALQDEVRRLHQSLEEVVDTGEQIKDNSYKKIDQTLNKMEAHHSKATHNMKMELAKLQNVNAKLEEQLSITKIRSDESFKDKHKYVSQIIHLQNEREIIVTDIKQLEQNCVGDSYLSPNSCSVEDVLKSLDKIRRSIEARNSKSTNLEQTLLKVQTSSQLLISKADEAKKLVEKEKQKIINEKEEAIADRINMERQLLNLKVLLEEQTDHDKKIIKDLEGEILNQQLIIDKLNDSTQNYISKLEEEMHTLQDLYQNSLAKINVLQDKIKTLSDENEKNVYTLDKINFNLMEKSEHVSSLQKALDELKNKPVKDVEVQVGKIEKKKNTKSQTDEASAFKLDDELKNDDDTRNVDITKVNKLSNIKTTPDRKPKDMTQSFNEVQILTANVEPTLDFVKSCYIDYKKKRLGPGKLHHVSISASGDSLNEATINSNLVDIYNRASDINTVSSKAIKTEGETVSASVMHDPQTPSKSSHFTGFGLTNDISDSLTKSELMSPKAGTSSDRDLFIIYQDSGSSHADNNSFKNKNLNNRQQAILVEAVTMQKKRNLNIKSQNNTRLDQKDDKPYQKDIFQDRIKQPLEVKIPSVPADTTSYETITDDAKANFEARSKNQVNKEKSEPTQIRSDQSHHRLSRVEADCLIFKNEVVQEKSKISSPSKDFGLKYILNSIKHEILHPENMGNVHKNLHKSLSDDLYQQIKTSSEGGPSIQSNLIINSSDNKTMSLGKLSVQSNSKSVVEQGIMVDIDAPDFYENMIRHLSQQLENTERDYKKKINAIKIQYDQNIKGILNEHNQGVKSIQNLHEDTLQDIIKIHENEVENLRTMSIEAMRKADKLERENRLIKSKFQDCKCGCIGLDEEPIKISTADLKKRRSRCRGDTKMLTKTHVEAFDVRPKIRIHGPCTCSLEVNVSDTIRNIFEQVDVEQRKLAEHAYLKYIANKIMSASVESLDVHELSFLHLKVCRTWKSKLSKEEVLQKRIETLESELLNKQRCTQQHIADLDRRVAEERHRLQKAREAVCPCSPQGSNSQASTNLASIQLVSDLPNPPNTEVLETTLSYTCLEVNERRSAGDLMPGISRPASPVRCKPQKSKPENKATLAKQEVDERRVKKSLYDEPPTRLRRSHDRPARGSRK